MNATKNLSLSTKTVSDCNTANLVGIFEKGFYSNVRGKNEEWESKLEN
jgi:hypothetical protein